MPTLLQICKWLQSHGIGCPRCGGGNKGYSTWIVQGNKVVCDNCFYGEEVTWETEPGTRASSEQPPKPEAQEPPFGGVL